jgi:thiamine biosynthesis lipoprotein
MTRLRLVVLTLALSGLAAGCSRRGVVHIEGRTMGTTYRVTVVTASPGARDALKSAIDGRLDELNRHLSTWDDTSEISRFNRLERAGVEFAASPDFLRVMGAAREIFTLSGGAWDGTVRPLVDLWGFGPSGPARPAPTPEEIAAALGEVGFDRIEVRPSGTLVKRTAGVTVDLSSIAKGYGVDVVAELLVPRAGSDFLIEIGGEVYASGSRPGGGPWRVGINRPDPSAGHDEVYRVVALHDEALATSGDYRSFFLEDGARRSHVIDPRTGRPVANGVVSVTVRAPTCMQADGLATAVMVMGEEDGLALVERLPDVEAFVVVADPDGSLRDHASSGFRTEDAPR